MQPTDDGSFDIPDLPTDAIEPLRIEVVVTPEQIGGRARTLWRRGGKDAFINWLRAEREVTWIAARSIELGRSGSADAVANWRAAEAELDEFTGA
jgi:hypothetical protein